MHNEINVTVASCVVRVTDLDRSVDLYRDIFSCRSRCNRTTWHYC